MAELLDPTSQDILDIMGQGSSKGDIIAANAIEEFQTLPVGTDGFALIADSAETLGVKWADPTAGAQTPWLSDINANINNLLNMGFYELNQITEPANGASQLARFWVESINNSLSTFKFKTGSGIVQTIQEDIIIQVRNTSGSTITKGSVVYASGESGNKIRIELARADVDATMPAIGIAVEDIAHNSNGIILNQGREQELNLSAFTAGDIIFVSDTVAGGFTSTPPVHPSLRQALGIVINDSPTVGEIGVVVEQFTGGEAGTNKNNFSIGDSLAGAKTLSFINANTGALSWNPTASRTITIPDATATLVGIGIANQLTNTELTSGVFAKITGIGIQTQALDMGSNVAINALNPSNPQDLSTKNYVDQTVTGLSVKIPCRVATTANITLSGNQTIDGVLTVNGDRVLVKDQTLGQNNGIYIADASTWTRSEDTDTDLEMQDMATLIDDGLTNKDTGWLLQTDPPIDLGTTVLVFVQFTALAQLNAGDGLVKTGSTLNVVGTTNRIIANPNDIDISPNYVGQASITTLGTITTGVWNGTDIDYANLDLTASIVDGDMSATGDAMLVGIEFIIDGGGSIITTGIKGDLEIPFNCTIERATLLADQTGSIVVDIWKDTFANYPPTDADSITASAVPTITSDDSSQDSTLTGWTTSISEGDTLRFNVDSVSIIERVTISLKVRKT